MNMNRVAPTHVTPEQWYKHWRKNKPWDLKTLFQTVPSSHLQYLHSGPVTRLIAATDSAPDYHHLVPLPSQQLDLLVHQHFHTATMWQQIRRYHEDSHWPSFNFHL